LVFKLSDQGARGKPRGMHELNCKMIWIEGAFRYRNPNHDLPKDFEQRREYYYGLLGLPLKANEFTTPLKNGVRLNNLWVELVRISNHKLEKLLANTIISIVIIVIIGVTPVRST
jgi:hypothetical protein